MWRIRKNLFPKQYFDFIGLTFLVVCFFVYYWFEVFVVVYSYHSENKVVYALHFIWSTYLLFNVTGNYIAMVLIDSSIRGVMLIPPDNDTGSWRFCAVCETRTPPRSWHCNICQICILKRDHHCTFASCCVGHENHRFFLMFLFYMCISSAYCAAYNCLFLWKVTPFSWINVLKTIFPVGMFIFGFELSVVQVYRILCVISFFGSLVTAVLLVYHMKNVIRGQVIHEHAHNISTYNLGYTVENLKVALGEKWYITWFSPFIQSKLNCDGIYWDKLLEESSKMK